MTLVDLVLWSKRAFLSAGAALTRLSCQIRETMVLS